QRADAELPGHASLKGQQTGGELRVEAERDRKPRQQPELSRSVAEERGNGHWSEEYQSDSHRSHHRGYQPILPGEAIGRDLPPPKEKDVHLFQAEFEEGRDQSSRNHQEVVLSASLGTEPTGDQDASHEASQMLQDPQQKRLGGVGDDGTPKLVAWRAQSP